MPLNTSEESSNSKSDGKKTKSIERNVKNMDNTVHLLKDVCRSITYLSFSSLYAFVEIALQLQSLLSPQVDLRPYTSY